MTDYTGNFALAMGSNDKQYIGSESNIYPDNIWLRMVQLQTGFTVWSGENNLPLACLDSCYIGVVTFDPTDDRCWVCDISKTLDTDGLCKDSCAKNYYIKTDSVSFKQCQQCGKSGIAEYYVNSIGNCILAAC